MTGTLDERLCAALERWGGLPCSDYATEALRRELAARGLKVVEVSDASANGRPAPFEGVNAGSTPAASTTDLRAALARVIEIHIDDGNLKLADRILALVTGSGDRKLSLDLASVWKLVHETETERDAALAKLAEYVAKHG